MGDKPSGFGHYVGANDIWLDVSFLPDWQTGQKTPSGYGEFLAAVRGGTTREINAASLSRIFQHYWKRAEQGFAIMSPWVAGLEEQVNVANLQKFKGDASVYGYFRLTGRWPSPSRIGDTETEPSFFIPNISLQDAQSLASKYKQWSFMYAGPDMDNVQPDDKQERVWEIEVESGKMTEKGDLHVITPGQVSDAYSRMRAKGPWQGTKRTQEESDPIEGRGEIPSAGERAFTFPPLEETSAPSFNPDEEDEEEISLTQKEGRRFYFSLEGGSSGEASFLRDAWNKRAKRPKRDKAF